MLRADGRAADSGFWTFPARNRRIYQQGCLDRTNLYLVREQVASQHYTVSLNQPGKMAFVVGYKRT